MKHVVPVLIGLLLIGSLNEAWANTIGTGFATRAETSVESNLNQLGPSASTSVIQAPRANSMSIPAITYGYYPSTTNLTLNASGRRTYAFESRYSTGFTAGTQIALTSSVVSGGRHRRGGGGAVTTTTALAGVPESGSTLILLLGSLGALCLWHRAFRPKTQPG